MVRQTSAIVQREATLFSRYISGRTPTAAVVELYAHALHAASPMTAHESKLLAFSLRHPWAIGCIDGGLVFLQPHAELRRRLYVMFAILEAMPEYSDLFLPRQRSIWYIGYIGFAGIRAVFRAVAGIIIIKAIRA